MWYLINSWKLLSEYPEPPKPPIPPPPLPPSPSSEKIHSPFLLNPPSSLKIQKVQVFPFLPTWNFSGPSRKGGEDTVKKFLTILHDQVHNQVSKIHGEYIKKSYYCKIRKVIKTKISNFATLKLYFH